MKITKEKLDDLSRKANELKTLQEIFKQFSDKTWTEKGELTRRLHNAEASNQHFSQDRANLVAEINKLNGIGQTLIKDKDRDAQTIASLTRLLEHSVENFTQLNQDYEKLVAKLGEKQAVARTR